MRPSRPSASRPLVVTTALLIAAAGMAPVIAALSGGGAGSGRPRQHSPAVNRPPALADLLGVRFDANAGQFDASVKFVARRPGSTLFLTETDAVISMAPPGATTASVRMRFAGGNPRPHVAGLHPLAGTSNYLLGDDPGRWKSGVPSYGSVEYSDVYPGVDVLFHGHDTALEYDVVVAPGADPRAVKLGFHGADRIYVDGAGDLVLAVGQATVRMNRPVIYQRHGTTRRHVAGGFTLNGDGTAGFTIGPYDRGRPLVIDPVISSTYLGGAATENANSVAVDAGGNTYVTGYTESPDFPTVEPLQAAVVDSGDTGVRNDVFITKLNRDGTSVVWSTYLGGRGREAGDAIAVGPDDAVYVAGNTESSDFPTAKAFQAANGGGPTDAFIAKLKPDGSALEYSSYLGGRATDVSRGVAVDPGGSAYVTGSTSSPNFPSVKALANAGGQPDDIDAFVVKVIPDGTGVAYSTRLGAAGDDHGVDIAIDAEGHAYVVGDTRSPGFPTMRPLQATSGGTASGTGGSHPDAFVTKLGPTGSSIVYSTFLGGSESDQGSGIAVDGAGSAYVTGNTRSGNFPTSSPIQGRNEGDLDAFLSKLSPDGSALVYSTYLGGSAADGGAAVAVDGDGNAYIAGSTSSSNLPTARPLQGANAGGLVDAFVAKFNRLGVVLITSTYFGGSGDDQASDITVDKAGNAHIAGYTNSLNLPVVRPFQPRAAAGVDVFVARLTEGTGSGTRTVTRPAPGSGDRDRRIRFLLATTLVLFVLALCQTLYLRRRDGGSRWRDGEVEEPAAASESPVPAGATGATREPAAEAAGATAAAGAPGTAVPATEDAAEQEFAGVEAPGGGALSFWDLFPSGPPPPPDPGVGGPELPPVAVPPSLPGDRRESGGSWVRKLLDDWPWSGDDPEIGPAGTGPAETGPAETGPAGTGPAETGPAPVPPAPPPPAPVPGPRPPRTPATVQRPIGAGEPAGTEDAPAPAEPDAEGPAEPDAAGPDEPDASAPPASPPGQQKAAKRRKRRSGRRRRPGSG